MTCREFCEQARDWVREGRLPGDAELHSASCEDCSAAWSREHRLSDLLASGRSTEIAPVRIETSVIAAFNAWRRRRWRVPLIAGAVAAMLLLLIPITLRRKPSQPAAADPLMTEFLPLRSAPLLPEDSAHLVRIRLRQSEVRRLGLPAGVNADNRLVDADVLIGQDGAARAVRFIRVQE